MREGIPLHALQKLYELHTPKSFGHEGSKAWALSVVPHFSLSLLSLVFLAWCAFHACLRFAHCTIPEEKWGLLVVYCILYLYHRCTPLTNQFLSSAVECRLKVTRYPLRLHGILGWRHRGTRMVSPSTVGNTERGPTRGE